jgi:hypothetical protein
MHFLLDIGEQQLPNKTSLSVAVVVLWFVLWFHHFDVCCFVRWSLVSLACVSQSIV